MILFKAISKVGSLVLIFLMLNIIVKINQRSLQSYLMSLQNQNQSTISLPRAQVVTKSEIFIANVLGHIVTIVICIFSYDIYILLDEYFHTIIFSILVGASIKPLKQQVVQTILNFLYSNPKQNEINQTLLQAAFKSFIMEAMQQDLNKRQQNVLKEVKNKTEEDPINIFGLIAQKALTNQDKKGQKSKSKANKQKSQEQKQNIDKLDQNTQSQKKLQVKPKYQYKKILKQILNVAMALGILAFIKNNAGLLILFFVILGEQIIKKIWKRIIYPLTEFSLIKNLLKEFQNRFPKQTLQKKLSSTVSSCCIILLIFLIIGSTIFCFYMVEKDIGNIKRSIQKSAYKDRLVQFASEINIQQMFNSTIFATLHKVNVTQQITKFIEGSKKEMSNNTKNCIFQVQSYTQQMIPVYIIESFCGIYSEIQIKTLKQYFKYVGQFFDTLNNLVGFSFQSIFGLINSFALLIFKLFIFFPTTYYIIQQLDIQDFFKTTAKFIQKKDMLLEQATSQPVSPLRDFLVELKSIMSSSLIIGFFHFLFSWIMLDVFSITQFNFIISIFLGIMAMLPIYQPYIGAGAVIALSYYFTQRQYNEFILPTFFVIYYYGSGRIFTYAYAKIDIPGSFTSLSVILGVYSYGILGVVYGPLIVVIMKRLLNLFK